MKIEPPEEEFDPDQFDEPVRTATISEGVAHFNRGEYYEAHECFERCWLASEGVGSDFWKGLVQAAICLDHLGRNNISGAQKLHSGTRRLLAPFLPEHEGMDLVRLLSQMQAHLQNRSSKAPTLERAVP